MNPVANTSSIVDLADFYESDKGMKRPPHHGYGFMYDSLFLHLKNEPINLLELGLAKTSQDFRGRSETRSNVISPSVSIWLNYFSQAHVVGFDLSDFSNQDETRFTFIKGDLGIERDYAKIADLKRKFQIVVDDGSHASFHQILAFKNIFNLMEEGGLYIIEDTWRQPPALEKEFPTSHTIASLFREFMRLGYFPETHPVLSEDLNCFADQIHNIMFVPYHNNRANDDQMIVVQKSSNSNFYQYRSKIRFFRSKIQSSDEDSLKENSRLFPDNPYPFHHLSRYYLSLGKTELALEMIEKAYSLSSEDHDIAIQRILLLALTNNEKESLETYRASATTRVSAEIVALDAAKLLIDRKLFGTAKAILLDLHESDPDISLCNFRIGLCCESENDWDQSEFYVGKALSVLPGNLDYLKIYARIARKSENKEMLSVLGKLEPSYTGVPEYWKVMAMTHKSFGNFEQESKASSKIPRDKSSETWKNNFITRRVKKLLAG